MRCLLILLALVLLPHTVNAQSLSDFAVSQSDNGPIIEFEDGEYILSDGTQTLGKEWKRDNNPNIYRVIQNGWNVGDYHTLAGRFHFDRNALGSSPIALYTVSTRSNFIVSINGREVFRNFAKVSDENNPWYRPFLVPIPTESLRQGINEIEITAISKEAVAIGRVLLGSHDDLEQYHQSKFFWQITGPKLANSAMVLLGFLVFLFWLGRRQEIELLWLSISTLLWFLRNYQYFAEAVPFNLAVFTVLPVYATYFASAASAAFYLSFTKMRYRKRLIAFMFLAGIPLILVQLTFSLSDFVIYIPTALIVFGVAILGFLDLKRYRDVEHGVLGFAMMTTPLATLYDLYIAVLYAGNGNASYISVFGGLFYALAFLISFGKRALDAFIELEKSNTVLARSIAETRAELAESESARQQLIVEQAIAGERGRLMQEMHDGIGSNLVTALAIARKQQQPEATVKTLSRALSDLKITVDSLEPVEGDIVVLIANLRHRMASDLRDAGIQCKWEVEKCAPIPWLDATNALHVLRIFQETISNVLSHSNATEMRIGCVEQRYEGVPGISVYVSDNGDGFDEENVETAGKGLSNIHARAQSLHGKLSSRSEVGSGSVVTLWLPYERGAEAGPD